MTQFTLPHTDAKLSGLAFASPVTHASIIVLSLWSFATYTNPSYIMAAALFAVFLAALSVIDYKYLALPNRLTLSGLAVGLVAMPLLTHTLWYFSLAGAVAGFALFGLIYLLMFKLTGKEALGFGDVKLMAMIGAWVGITGVPLVMLLSSAVAFALILGRRLFKGTQTQVPIPYGPSLCIAAWLTFLYEAPLWSTLLMWRETLVTFILGAF